MMNTVPTVPARRRTPTWLWVALTLLALTALIVISLLGVLSQLEGVPVRLIIDGTEYGNFDLSMLSGAHKAALVGAMVLAVFAVLIVVPLALLIGIAALLFGLIIGVGVPILVTVLVAALVFSPLLLLFALAAWLWRKSRATATVPTATIAG